MTTQNNQSETLEQMEQSLKAIKKEIKFLHELKDKLLSPDCPPCTETECKELLSGLPLEEF